MMNKEIKSKVLGSLQQDLNFSDWWKSDKIEIPFFDNEKLAITLVDFEVEYDLTFLAKTDHALTAFLKLNVGDRNLFSDQVYKSCMGFGDENELNEFYDLIQPIKDCDKIWNFIYPRGIYVIKPLYKDQDVYIQIVCKCNWEQERWIELIFREGKEMIKISDDKKNLTEVDTPSNPKRRNKRLCNRSHSISGNRIYKFNLPRAKWMWWTKFFSFK